MALRHHQVAHTSLTCRNRPITPALFLSALLDFTQPGLSDDSVVELVSSECGGNCEDSDPGEVGHLTRAKVELHQSVHGVPPLTLTHKLISAMKIKLGVEADGKSRGRGVHNSYCKRWPTFGRFHVKHPRHLETTWANTCCPSRSTPHLLGGHWCEKRLAHACNSLIRSCTHGPPSFTGWYLFISTVRVYRFSLCSTRLVVEKTNCDPCTEAAFRVNGQVRYCCSSNILPPSHSISPSLPLRGSCANVLYCVYATCSKIIFLMDIGDGMMEPVGYEAAFLITYKNSRSVSRSHIYI